MLRGLVPAILLGLLAVTLAGCSGQAPPSAGDDLAANGMTIVGLVQNETFVPIAGAQVSVRLTNFAASTDAGGLFTFTGLPLSPYLVDVAAAGFANATLNAEPLANVSLSFILLPPADVVPPPVQLHFTGKFQCALEAFIISPSCDTVLDVARERVPETPDPFEDISTFDVGLNARWATVVVDVDFAEHPALQGLRVTVQGRNDADQLDSYEQYGRFHGSDPFTFRLEPGQTYDDGSKPVPSNASALQLEVYPQGTGWHALCSDPLPPDALPQCPLGVGAGRDVQFDLYVTLFYVEPAPADYTLLP